LNIWSLLVVQQADHKVVVVAVALVGIAQTQALQ
jgi:hypothetical protein